MSQLEIRGGFDEFRDYARTLLLAGVEPSQVRFSDPQLEPLELDLFASATTSANLNSTLLPNFPEPSSSASELRIAPPTDTDVRSSSHPPEERPALEGGSFPLQKPAESKQAGPKNAGPKFMVPKEFLELAVDVAHHSSPKKWALLYRLLWRLKHENRKLLEIATDDDVREANHFRKAVTREIHKIHAFVRFQKIAAVAAELDAVSAAISNESENLERYVAWMRTDHPCLKLAAPFFARRFGDRPWSILTPYESAHWDMNELTFTEGVAQAPERQDEIDDLWKSYYRSIFNPARVKIKAMKAEMPVRYWNALPEAEMIRDLIRESPDRLRKMARNQNSRANPPDTSDWNVLREAASACSACPLHALGHQTVFGEGPRDARVMIIGEQPGDTEDTIGRPFVGPAGEVLDRALAHVGLDRTKIYVTNSVKHFKWKPGPPGTPRLHQKPSGSEMHACKPWLEREISLIRPDVVICLGQTASTALLGRMIKIGELKGKVLTDLPWAPKVLVSYHPSAILRAGSPREAHEMEESLRSSLATVAIEAAKKKPGLVE